MNQKLCSTNKKGNKVISDEAKPNHSYIVANWIEKYIRWWIYFVGANNVVDERYFNPLIPWKNVHKPNLDIKKKYSRDSI